MPNLIVSRLPLSTLNILNVGPSTCFILGHEKLSLTDCVLLTGLAVGQKAEDALKGHVLGSATQLQAVLLSIFLLPFVTSVSCHVSLGEKRLMRTIKRRNRRRNNCFLGFET